MTWTAEALDEVLKRGHVKIVEARVVRLMDAPEKSKGLEIPAFVQKRPRPPQHRKKLEYEKQLGMQMEKAGITGFEIDARYIPERQFRADALFRKQKLVVEIQGACHRIRDKWKRDIEKAQLTLLEGYRLLPIGTNQVRDGTAVVIVQRALGMP